MRSSGLILCLLMLLDVGPLFARGHLVEGRTYAMPVTETAEVISAWLEKSGFNSHQLSTIPQQIELTAEKPNIQWRISLEPDSPLATHVQIELALGSDDLLVKRFWQALDEYVQMPDGGPNDNDTLVPEEVRAYLVSVVCIYADRAGEEYQFSGFIVDPSGLIVCTAHDLQSGQPVSVSLRGGRKIRGQVVKIDKWRDLSLIRVKAKLHNAISLRTGRYLLQNGDLLYAINCPDGGANSIRSGFLDGPPRRVAGLPLWQAQLHVDPGSSGSPVFDGQGRLSAIVKGRYRGTDSVGFLIPFETLLHFLGKY